MQKRYKDANKVVQQHDGKIMHKKRLSQKKGQGYSVIGVVTWWQTNVKKKLRQKNGRVRVLLGW